MIQIIPDFLRQTTENHRDDLLVWCSNFIYQKFAADNARHPLLQLERLLDLSEFEAACRGFHKHNGMGCPITHPVAHLVRALLIRYLYNYSLRETEAATRDQIPVKRFIGCPLHRGGVSYSTLSRFENYVCQHHPRLFFDVVLRQIDIAFPDHRLQPQIADTFAMLANAQRETLIGRLRHAAALLLIALHQEWPGLLPELLNGAGAAALMGNGQEEKAEFLLDAVEKQARLQAVVIEAVALLERVAPHLGGNRQARFFERALRDVLTKEVEITRDQSGQIVAVRQFREGERGTFRPFSATDPEATIRNHGPGKQDDGFNVSVAATTSFICEIQVATGSQPDAAGIVPLLEAQQENRGVLPPKLIYDKAAGHGQTIAAVAIATAGQTQLVVKPVQAAKKKGSGELGPLDCQLMEQPDPETGELRPALVCPGGQTTTVRYRATTAPGWSYRMAVSKCAGCPLFSPCRDKVASDKQPRNWFISAYREPILAARGYAETEAFKADMKLRPQIERVIAGLVLHCGARYARFRGLAKVDFQAKMCATAYNLKRWLNLSDPNYRRRRRRTAAEVVLALLAA
jgi:hypothetical protein